MMKEKLPPRPGEGLRAAPPTKVFLILSAALSVLFAVFFTLMLVFNLTDAGDMAPLMYFFLFLAALGLACAAKGFDAFLQPGRVKYIAAFCAVLILLAAQLRLAKALYGNIIYDFRSMYQASLALAQDGTLGKGADYLARYPNNLFLTVIFSGVIRFCSFLNITNYMAVLTGLSLAAADLAILFACLCARRLWGSRAAWITALLCLPLIAFHYGLVCPYSDTFAMPFPPIFLYIYIHFTELGQQRQSRVFLLSSLMGALAAVGFKLKPHTLIILVALALTELFFRRLNKQRTLFLGKCLLCFALAAIVMLAGINAALGALTGNVLTDELREEKELPFTHFIMIGLNPETGGTYSGKDVAASSAFTDRSGKVAYNLSVAGRRLSDMGPAGYLQFLLRKGRTSFSGMDIDMCVRSPFPNTDPLSTALQENFCQGGQGFRVYQQFLEALWVILLLLWLLPVIFCPQSCRDRFGTVLRLAVMGFALFLLLFEGGPRYRFHQFPIFILLAVWGMQVLPAGLRDARAWFSDRIPHRSAPAAPTDSQPDCIQKETESDA